MAKTTDKHIAVGTLPYMAPEQLLEGAVSFQSDVYALALVFDEMLSGVHAFSPGRGIINPAMRDTVIRTRIMEGLYDPWELVYRASPSRSRASSRGACPATPNNGLPRCTPSRVSCGTWFGARRR